MRIYLPKEQIKSAACHCFQRTVDGVHGANGAHALKRVALDHSTAIVPVPTPLQHTEGNSVPEREQRRGTATQNNAQVLRVLRCCFGVRSGLLSDPLSQVSLRLVRAL